MRVLCLLPLLAAVANAGNLVEELKDLGNFNTLLSMVEKVGLAETAATGGPFTVFAPTDKAFKELGKTTNLSAITTETLKKIVLYHMLPSKVYSKDLQNDVTVNSVEGLPVRINIYNTTVTINGAEVEKADIEASNGVIHIVEATVDPIPTGNIAEVVSSDPRFSTLLAAVKVANLVETLSSKGPFTVFAPTNDAFAKVPKETLDGLLADKVALTKVLLRHVVPGTLFQEGIFDKEERFTAGGSTNQDVITFTVVDKDGGSSEENSAESSEEQGDAQEITVKTTAGSAKVVVSDIIATNGVIHAIDTVI